MASPVDAYRYSPLVVLPLPSLGHLVLLRRLASPRYLRRPSLALLKSSPLPRRAVAPCVLVRRGRRCSSLFPPSVPPPRLRVVPFRGCLVPARLLLLVFCAVPRHVFGPATSPPALLLYLVAGCGARHSSSSRSHVLVRASRLSRGELPSGRSPDPLTFSAPPGMAALAFVCFLNVHAVL